LEQQHHPTSPHLTPPRPSHHFVLPRSVEFEVPALKKKIERARSRVAVRQPMQTTLRPFPRIRSCLILLALCPLQETVKREQDFKSAISSYKNAYKDQCRVLGIAVGSMLT
jgi:hypothetical protein